jgi:CHAD domain-containing protein
MITELVGYSFKVKEPIHAAIKRIAQEEIASAANQLEGHGDPDRDEAIHEARKNVKKVRGLLKLMRPELGATYAIENARFREIGQKLSEFRDSGAMLEIFDQLAEVYVCDWAGHDTTPIRAKLLEEKAFRESAAGIGEILAAVSAELRSASEDVKGWPLQADGLEAISPGLEATYRSGRRAMKRALREPLPENFHGWRKRVKDHWYHVRLIGQVCGDALAFYQKNLRHLETCLGDDHNLAVLQQKLSKEPELYGSQEVIGMFLDSVKQRQQSLRSTAESIGQQIYQEKPRMFVKQMRTLWEGRIKDRERIYSSLPVTG